MSRRSALRDRFLAWLVTGSLARGAAFVIDFSVLIATGGAIAVATLTRRLRRRIL
jgi:hypothetical protein